MNRTRGGTLIELLVCPLILFMIGSGMLTYFVTMHQAHESIRVGNIAITNGREPIDVVSDHIRNAQQYTTDNVTYSVISAASPTSITYYGSEGGATVQYTLNGTNLERTDASGTTVVLSNIASLNFKYFLSNSSFTYYFTSLVEGTDPANFTLTDRSRITVVEISGSVNVGGYVRTFKTQIRLRNSPRKTKL